MPDPFFTLREQQMLRKLAGFILPLHSPDNGKDLYDIVGYLQNLFTALTQNPPSIYRGGPFSGRHPKPGDPPGDDDFNQFLPMTRHQQLAWNFRLNGPDSVAAQPFIVVSDEVRKTYSTGLIDLISEGLRRAIQLEDGMAPRRVMAGVLLSEAGGDFQIMFFQLIAEASFSAPEYGGNLAAWQEIFYPGDSLPAGYTGNQISDPDPDAQRFPIQPLAGILFDFAVAFMGGRKFK